MSERWSIYIDIEGFSALWGKGDRVLWSLGELMRSIFQIGRECFPNSPERLFAHQLGDGFVVVSDFHEESLERCATIAIAIMRHMAVTGCFARGAISEGEFSDIQGCYPRAIRDALEGDHTVSLHMGLMTINPVMGTALIRAVGVDKRAPRGPLLTIESSRAERLGSRISRVPIEGGEIMSIDWIHGGSSLLSGIQKDGALNSPKSAEIESILIDYCRREAVPEDWRENVHMYLGIRM